MKDNIDILNDLLTGIETDIINSMQANGRYATGDTISELQIVVYPGGGQLLAPAYIDALEYGRGPTSAGASESDPTLQERIEAWIAAKRIDLNPYAVTKKIHKQGYPGKPGVLTEPLELVDKKVSDACSEMGDNYMQEVAELFDIFE